MSWGNLSPPVFPGFYIFEKEGSFVNFVCSMYAEF